MVTFITFTYVIGGVAGWVVALNSYLNSPARYSRSSYLRKFLTPSCLHTYVFLDGACLPSTQSPG